MGGFLAMHFVERLERKIDKLICIAPIFNGLHKYINWDLSQSEARQIGFASMQHNYDPEKIKQNTKSWKIFLSDNDKYINFPEAREHFDAIGVYHIDLSNAWHFCEGDGYATFPALLDMIIPSIRVYTTRVDTVYGMTYAVLAPDHPKVESFITDEYRTICDRYIEEMKGKSDIDRTNEWKEKTGVFTGSYVVNPYNDESVPLWIADYVLGSYGTGAVMAVPAHDERDMEFAQKYDLPIKQSIGQKFWKEWADSTHRERVWAIIMREGAILCEKVNSKDTKFNGEYLLIWWGIEKWENPTQALRREIMEELGIADFKVIKQLWVYSTHWFSLPKQENRSMIHHIFAIEFDPTKISENTAEAELEWVPIDKLLADLDQYDKKDQSDAIRRMMNKWIFTDDGFLVQSWEYDSISSSEARKVFSEKAEKEGFGHKKVNYKLRDWLFSRQRYWGEPIPLIHINHDDYVRLPSLTEKDGISYISLTGSSTPRSDRDIKVFDPVNAIVKHATEDKYIVLTFKNGERWLVWGSVEIGETRDEAIIWEVIEETGYQHVKIEKIIISQIYSRGYKERKNQEEEALESVYLVTVLDDTRVVVPSEEGISSADWIDGEDVSSSITLSHHRFYWDYFYQAPYAYRIQRDDREFLMIDGVEFSQLYDGINGKIIIDSRLPLTLPEVEKYEPAGDGQSPLATVPSFVNVKLADNLSWKRETNTMPQWWGSCWYYLRYMDSQNTAALAGQDALEYWQNVDEYVGGAEHAVLHLLYARFWHKVLYDIGVVPTLEPFQKLTNVGMILAYAYERADGGLVAVDLVDERDGKYFETETGKEVKQVVAKMSKSLKNVVNPNDIVTQYGADTLRLYEMSMSGFTDTAPWNPDAIIGVRRFLDRAYATFTEGRNTTKDDMKAMKLLYKTVKKVGEDIVEYKFNTAISALMILLNEWIPVDPEFALEWKEKFAILLHPFAPHMAEELWNLIPHPSPEGEGNGISSSLKERGQAGEVASIYDASWPDYDEWMLVDDEVTIAIQVNGKLRGTLTCLNGVMQDEVSSLAHEDPDIMKWIEGKTLVREIYIPNKLLSIVVKD
jgi:leucyl-tRNA synthetase